MEEYCVSEPVLPRGFGPLLAQGQRPLRTRPTILQQKQYGRPA